MNIALVLLALGFALYFTRPECEHRGNICEAPIVSDSATVEKPKWD